MVGTIEVLIVPDTASSFVTTAAVSSPIATADTASSTSSVVAEPNSDEVHTHNVTIAVAVTVPASCILLALVTFLVANRKRHNSRAQTGGRNTYGGGRFYGSTMMQVTPTQGISQADSNEVYEIGEEERANIVMLFEKDSTVILAELPTH